MAEKKKWYGVRYGEKTGVDFMTYSQVMTWKPQQYKGFEKKEDAEKYATVEPIDWDKNEAIVYVDGSLNFDSNKVNTFSPDKLYGSYGIIIFLKGQDKPFYVESAKILDGDGQRKDGGGNDERNYYVWRYNADGARVRSDRKEVDSEVPEEYWYQDVIKNTEPKGHGFVMASWTDVSETLAACRALQICCDELGLHYVTLVYDHAALWDIYFEHDKKKNVTNYCGEIFEKYKDAGKEIRFIKVGSHENGNYDRNDPLFVHGLYNDCVDILAKAETDNKPIGNKENPNLYKIVGKVSNLTKDDICMRRMEARTYLQNVQGVVNPYKEMTKVK
ncbi:MAG: hypothetical protein PUD77_09640 [Clostridiales bacterium]|nr:hypothetical protein [Clostridiales bacterium]